MPREKGRKRKARAGLSEFEEVKRLVEKCQSGTGNKNVNSGAGRPIDEKALQRIRTSGMEVLRLLAGPASSISIGIFFSSLVRIARFRRWATTINQLIFKASSISHWQSTRMNTEMQGGPELSGRQGGMPGRTPEQPPPSTEAAEGTESSIPLAINPQPNRACLSVSWQACHEALANPAAVYREDPENEAFTRIRSKPEIVEKYGTGRVSHNSMPALKQVTAALEQIGAKSDVPNHRLLNRGDRSHSSGEEYPEPNAQGIMEEVEQEVELYVRPPYTRRNKAVWMGTAERPIPIPLLSLLYRRVANTENRFLNQMSTTLKAKLHMFPAMTREENGYRSCAHTWRFLPDSHPTTETWRARPGKA
eukprot:tig00020920_g15915.t1